MIQSGTIGQSQDQAERGLLRFYYSNRRPTWFGRLSNQAWAYATALGLTSPIVATLQVKDRRDGRLRSTVLVPSHYEGERYLVSMLGGGSEWVKNVCAADGEAFITRGQAQPVTLIEIPPSDRAPILKAWCQVATSGRQHLPVAYDAPISAFEAIAADYPVFRIDGADRFGSQARSSPHPLRFFGWVLLLSIPFYAWGVFWPIEALPFGLPVSATMILVPALVATVMTWREQGAPRRRGTLASRWRCQTGKERMVDADCVPLHAGCDAFFLRDHARARSVASGGRDGLLCRDACCVCGVFLWSNLRGNRLDGLRH
jgi:hypothetical protein